MHTYELLYFPLRGRGEQVRLMFALKDVPVTEVTVPPPSWPTVKPTTPFGQIPVLTERGDEGEIVIPESGAILRHLARRFDMYGDTARQRAMCDALADLIATHRAKLAPVAYAAFFHTTPEVIAKFWEEVPHTLELLEKVHSRSTAPAAGWFIGEKLTFADVTTFDFLDAVQGLKPEVLDSCPGLKGFVERFRALPTIAPFLKGRNRP